MFLSPTRWPFGHFCVLFPSYRVLSVFMSIWTFFTTQCYRVFPSVFFVSDLMKNSHLDIFAVLFPSYRVSLSGLFPCDIFFLYLETFFLHYSMLSLLQKKLYSLAKDTIGKMSVQCFLYTPI